MTQIEKNLWECYDRLVKLNQILLKAREELAKYLAK